MTTWKATIKERWHENLLTPTYTGDVNENFLIDFWGLKEPDVEWYKLEKIENNDKED